ncbi:MAG: thiolase family protein, partial [Deltaproteobacteria bacterium]|nr:thiolase family protein [Deltaproteobacteria bacterium]MBW2534816.1 thiolase family protein [Deltaproteobacteria bacterium]
MELRNAVIVDAARTAIGRVGDGAFSTIRAEDMLAIVFRALLARNPGLPAGRIEDVLVGCSFPEAEQGLNLGRRVAMLAGLPLEVPGITINRFCAAGADALHSAARSIMTGCGDAFLVGGVENMSHVPLGGFRRADGIHPALVDRGLVYPMTQTAEEVAEEHGVSREEMDALALRSHRLAAAAARSGIFAEEILPVGLPGGGVADRDENIREDATLEKIAALD